MACGYSKGDLSFDPSLPVDSVTDQIHTPVLGYFPLAECNHKNLRQRGCPAVGSTAERY
jgi:hypothetical protein